MVANYESSYQTIDINISNLPWSITDQIKVNIENVTDSGLVIYSSDTTGSTAMTVHLTGVVDASTYLITLRKKSALPISNSIPGIQFTVSPNPSNSIFNIQTDLANYKIALSNMQGQQIFSENNCKQFDVSSYASGIYFLTLTTSTGRVYTQKIVVDSE